MPEPATYRKFTGRRGFTLLEVVISAVLTGLIVLIVASLIPTGVIAVRKAQDMESATMYGVSVMEWARQNAPAGTITLTPTLNGAACTVNCDVQPVPGSPSQYDIQVQVTWDRQPRPVRLVTSVYRQP